MAFSILTLILIASTLRRTALVSANTNLAHVDRSRRPQPISQAHQVAKGPSIRSCPPVDKEGNSLDFHSENTKPMRCAYKNPVDNEKVAYCLYDKDSGALTLDHHNNKCPVAAVEYRYLNKPDRRRSHIPIPHSPRHPSAIRASSDGMKLRQALGERKHA
ncbi:hypothetical protein K443DRAFT_675289 [Laccaria amethystina LaAM-08-1]|uniref:Secreted protein n=1 Tax=Laccaria amethystina LaAM-08-1 TaxID=1095629 RepID=A0A0C9WZT0_9AGAR|nr:hypothetical protein K443DRAFT_675289 [Laccaria amethystina LaAM-08-1]